MTHPHVRAERRRLALLWAYSIAMMAWFLYMLLEYREGDGLGAAVTVLSVWVVGVVCIGLYAGYAPLPRVDVPAAPSSRVPPPLA